jgi:hypothetical protein
MTADAAEGDSPLGAVGADAGIDLFCRLVELYESNRCLSAELESVRAGLSQARKYRESAGANRVLADARLLRLRVRRSALLTLVRANRVQARSLAARVDSLAQFA